MSIWDTYLNKLNEVQKHAVLKTLASAKEFVPDSVEALPYGVPGLKLNGKNLIAIAAHKNHLGVYPFDPKIVTKISNTLENGATSKGTLRFGYNNLPSPETIRKIIELRKL